MGGRSDILNQARHISWTTIPRPRLGMILENFKALETIKKLPRQSSLPNICAEGYPDGWEARLSTAGLSTIT